VKLQQFFIDVLVTAVDVIEAIDVREAFGLDRGQHE
jgi:hypothetical protein